MQLKLRPSNSAQIMKCNGSALMQSRHPEPKDVVNTAAMEGAAAHYVAEMVLSNGEMPIDGDIAPNGVVIDATMIQCASDYVTEIFKYCNPFNLFNNVKIEENIKVPVINDDLSGTPDAYVWNPDTSTLMIWDLKYGFNIVDPFMNWQMICYASGIVSKLDHHVQFITVNIFQPRAYCRDGVLRSYTFSFDELRSYEVQLNKAFNSALGDDPQTVAGKHCKYCSARHACETSQRSTYEIVDYVGNCSSVEMEGNNLALEIHNLREAKAILEARLAGLEQQATSDLKSGKTINGFTLEQSKGRKRWKSDVTIDQIIMMGDLMGVDVRKPVELDTPSKIIKKGIDATVINAYSETPMTGSKLIELSNAKIRQAFKF